MITNGIDMSEIIIESSFYASALDAWIFTFVDDDWHYSATVPNHVPAGERVRCAKAKLKAFAEELARKSSLQETRYEVEGADNRRRLLLLG
jgi:hypothetical protein